MIYPLHGAIQPYAWGGTDYIAQLLRQTPDGTPKAELWFGDHPQAPARIDHDTPFDQWLRQHPHALSAQSRARFGDHLPYLLKILDVRLPLSIQLHPDKAQAEAGYARETAQHIPAAQRNYGDNNHKPESMIALSEFWLLHGFAPLEVMTERLRTRPSLAPIAELIARHGLHETYARILRATQENLAAWLHPLLDQPAPSQRSANPDYWLHHTCAAMHIARDALDAGLLSFYLFNIVHLQPGEGIYQPARLPHAYLHGQNIELMAASNNVLRAGLTPKHIDIDELLAIIDARPITPAIIPAANRNPYDYPAPIDDYTLHTLHLTAAHPTPWHAREASILLVISGILHIDDGERRLTVHSGEAAFLTADSRCTLDAEESAFIACASNK